MTLGFATVYFFFERRGVWASALAAADFDALLVRPSRIVFEAADAAALEVCFAGALCCDSALPAADLDFAPADRFRSTVEALPAVALLVTFLFAI